MTLRAHLCNALSHPVVASDTLEQFHLLTGHRISMLEVRLHLNLRLYLHLHLRLHLRLALSPKP